MVCHLSAMRSLVDQLRILPAGVFKLIYSIWNIAIAFFMKYTFNKAPFVSIQMGC